MTNRQSIDRRIGKLERHTANMDDANLLEWGLTVTDDELRSLAAGPIRSDSTGRRLRALHVHAITDIELYRLIKPGIESLRASAHE